MGTLKKEPVGREKGPDVVGALRDWVGSDHRIATALQSLKGLTPDRNPRFGKRRGSYQEDPAQPAQDLSDADPGSSSASAGGTYQEDPAQSAHNLSDGDAGTLGRVLIRTPMTFISPPYPGAL